MKDTELNSDQPPFLLDLYETLLSCESMQLVIED